MPFTKLREKRHQTWCSFVDLWKAVWQPARRVLPAAGVAPRGGGHAANTNLFGVACDAYANTPSVFARAQGKPSWKPLLPALLAQTPPPPQDLQELLCCTPYFAHYTATANLVVHLAPRAAGNAAVLPTMLRQERWCRTAAAWQRPPPRNALRVRKTTSQTLPRTLLR